MITKAPAKDPDSVEPYFIIWCSADGTNDGSVSDFGELQGAVIATGTWTVASGITKDSDNKSAVTIHGVSYAVNTVCTIWLSGGTNEANYNLTNRIITNDNRTLDKTITIPVRTQ